MAGWLTEPELLERVGMNRAELAWFEEQFHEQIRFLKRQDGDGSVTYGPDAIPLLQGLSAMVSQGATPEQIKGWFGLAATKEEKPSV